MGRGWMKQVRDQDEEYVVERSFTTSTCAEEGEGLLRISFVCGEGRNGRFLCTKGRVRQRGHGGAFVFHRLGTGGV